MVLALAAGASTAVRSGWVEGTELRRSAKVKLVEKVKDSVVDIHGQKTLNPGDEGYHSGDGPQKVNGMGTGVVIDERGYIITNHHVVDGVRRIQVTLADGEEYVGKLISHDAKTDLAIIKVDSPQKMPVISIGSSTDLMAGEEVVALGNAFGYGHTITSGIISALHRTVQVSDTQSYEDLIQTDASINPGNSGGPLLNIDGDMIGINVAVRAGAQGIGFAIPVDLAMSVAANLMSAERIGAAWHGVATRADKGLRVEPVVGEVEKESPAGKGGLRPGDLIKQVGEMPIARALDVERAMLGRKPGDEVKLLVERDKKEVNLAIVLASAPKNRAADQDKIWELIGLRLEPAPKDRIRKGESSFRGGLMVTAVRPDSPAHKRGIRRNDILVGMHEWQTTSLKDVAYVLNRPNLSDLAPLKVFIVRDNTTYWEYLPLLASRSR